MLYEIRLHNFRNYKDTQCIYLANQCPQNITVVSGLSGSGKTSIASAIYWCLHGNDDSVFNTGVMLNVEVARDMEVSSETAAEVSLIFRDNDGIIILQRRAVYKKEPFLEKIRIQREEYFINYKECSYAEYMRATNKILPRAYASIYYWSEGFIDQRITKRFARMLHEKLEKFNSYMPANRKISKEEFKQRYIKRFESIANKYLKELFAESHLYKICMIDEVPMLTNRVTEEVVTMDYKTNIALNIVLFFVIEELCIDEDNKQCAFPIIIDWLREDVVKLLKSEHLLSLLQNRQILLILHSSSIKNIDLQDIVLYEICVKESKSAVTIKREL